MWPKKWTMSCHARNLMFGVCLVIDRNAACVVPVILLPSTMPHKASRQWRRLLPDCPLICSLHISMTVSSGQLHCGNSSKSFNYNLPTLSLQQREHRVHTQCHARHNGTYNSRLSNALYTVAAGIRLMRVLYCPQSALKQPVHVTEISCVHCCCAYWCRLQSVP